ncbi:MAG: tetratricopeptide repeat protein, partial [Planctomycetota bacterium]
MLETNLRQNRRHTRPDRETRASHFLKLHLLKLLILCAVISVSGCGPNLTRPPARPAGSPEALVMELITPQLVRIERTPGDAEEHGTLGLMYEANEMWEAATRSFSNAVELDPNNPVWTVHLYKSRKSLGESAGEWQRLEALAQRFAKTAAFQYNLGKERLDNGDTTGAQEALENCLRLAPTEPATLIALSELALLLGDAPRALQLAQQALVKAPGHPAVLNARGQALRASGRAEEAKEDLQRGLQGGQISFPDEGSKRLAGYYAASQMLINHSANLIEVGFAARAEVL